MQAGFAERRDWRDAAAAECLCTLLKSVRCAIYGTAATRAMTSLLCFAQRPVLRLPAPTGKAETDASLLKAREPCCNAAAVCRAEYHTRAEEGAMG